MNKEAQMFALVAQWRQSGLSRRLFSDQHNITLKSFDYWCRKQSGKVVKPPSMIKASPKPCDASPGFVELSCDNQVSPKNQPVRMEFELEGGIRIKIY